MAFVNDIVHIAYVNVTEKALNAADQHYLVKQTWGGVVA
jgi:hypothetical protein